MGAATTFAPIVGSAIKAFLVNGAAGAAGNVSGQVVGGAGSNINWSQAGVQGAIAAVGGTFGNAVGLGSALGMVRSGASSANAINTSKGIGTLAAVAASFGLRAHHLQLVVLLLAASRLTVAVDNGGHELNIANALLAFVYVCIWSADGFNFGRLARRYYREEKLRWPNGKFIYASDWVLSMIWFIGSAFILGELDQMGDFDPVELLGPLALILAAAASLYHYRSR